MSEGPSAGAVTCGPPTPGSFRARVAATGLLVADAPLVVAVSGGRDSLCLLGLASEIAGADAVLAVHVHHGLRGRSADRDAERVTALASERGVAVRVVRLTVPEHVRARSGSPVSWARDARRIALRDAADRWAGPGTPVAVGHTTSDQAETVLLRAISSPGVRALAGIAPRDPARGVVRPLLAAGVTRADTGAWCTAHGVDWHDDPTNPGSPRGRIREVLATLEALDVRATGTLVATADRAREDDAALREVAAGLLHPGDERTDGAAWVRRTATAAVPRAVARRAIRLLAEATTERECGRIEGRIDDVLALEPGPGRPAALDLGDGVRVLVSDGADGRIWCAASPSRRPGRSL
ncbi:MAG: tRNA lysidine(34) synthetase TilS [Patulibacter sp.]|nr:tRNA lysidine(34) synthetase TilS [Patulibacter sp.]